MITDYQVALQILRDLIAETRAVMRRFTILRDDFTAQRDAIAGIVANTTADAGRAESALAGVRELLSRLGIEHRWLGSALSIRGPDGWGPYVNLIGPAGPEGAPGPRGERGDPGPQGSSTHIRGTLSSPKDLPDTGAAGDLYLMSGTGIGYEAGDGFAWDSDGWENVGKIRGPVGPRGYRGEVGPRGETGPAGARGEQGIQGIQGIRGEKGDLGLTGAPGATGAQGAKGDQGVAGTDGLDGLDGAPGAKGDRGEPGLQGPKGDKGDIGLTGPQGAKGDIGLTGAPGATGERGAPGVDGRNGVDGAIGATGATGPQGERGLPGLQGAQGDRGPTGPVGSKGDKGDIGLTGTPGATGQQGTPGVQGATGATGARGDVGPQGATGAQGLKGDVGPIGATGPKGDQGIQGQQGLQGVPGATGAAGPKGDTGATGAQGLKGDTGAQGLKGDQGPPGTTDAASMYYQDPAPNPGPRSIKDKLDNDVDVSPNAYRNLVVNGDWAPAINAAAVYAAGALRRLRMDGAYPVKSIVTFPAGLRVSGAGIIIGQASSPQTAVVEMIGGSIVTDGFLEIHAGYNWNYSCGVHVYGDQIQYVRMRGINVAGAQLGYRIGDRSKPGAILSETNIEGGHTYGCPRVCEIIGVEGYISIVNPIWSADKMGAPAGSDWGRDGYGILSVIGASVAITGGHCECTQETVGSLFDVQPLAGPSQGMVWGQLWVKNCVTETALMLALAWNPSQVSGPNNTGRRGVLAFSGCRGAHSQDKTAFIYGDTSFNGRILIESDNNWWHPGGNRSEFNVYVTNSGCDIYLEEGCFDEKQGFRSVQSGVAGGIVHFIGASQASSSFPPSDNTTMSGSVEKRWSELHAVRGYLSETLEISRVGADPKIIFHGDSSGTWNRISGNGPFALLPQDTDAASSPALFVQNGAVGVNKVGPGYALDVVGDIHATGVIFSDGAPLWTTSSAPGFFSSNDPQCLLQTFPSGGRLLIGSTVVRLDGNGQGWLTFAVAFPGTAMWCLGNNGDLGYTTGYIEFGQANAQGVNVRVRDGRNNDVIRINYLVYGN